VLLGDAPARRPVSAGPGSARAPQSLFLTLRDQGQKISGFIAFATETSQVMIGKVELNGDRLTFEAPDNVNHLVAFTLTVAVRSMSGEATSEGQTLKVNLSLQVNQPPATQSGLYHVGGGVSAPALIHKVEPEYTEEARKARLQGAVWLKVEISPEGKATKIKVLHALGMGLDEKAVECVTKWRFKPGLKDGEPVTVEAQIEVNFRLLDKPNR
jgi:TonB family protein